MSNSNFGADVKEDDDSKDGGDRNLDQQRPELRNEDGESISTTVTAGGDDVEKKQQGLGEGLCSSEDDDNDGFRTPTSIEHRIPVPTECPPAPRKSLKRKLEESSITDIIRSATKAIHQHIMALRKVREDDDALS